MHADEITAHEYTPRLTVSTEHYDADNVTVTVEWTQRKGVIYRATLLPSIPSITNTIIIHDQPLVLQYNTEYNFSVEAVAPCGSNATASIQLYYGKTIQCMYTI